MQLRYGKTANFSSRLERFLAGFSHTLYPTEVARVRDACVYILSRALYRLFQLTRQQQDTYRRMKNSAIKLLLQVR